MPIGSVLILSRRRKRFDTDKLFVVAGLFVCIGTLVYLAVDSFKQIEPVRPLEQILDQGKITLITQNNAHCYYLYKGREMGFEYDLARVFADYLGVSLDVVIAETWEDMTPLLRDNPGSFIASSMVITPEREKEVLFSRNYLAIRQHIIVHRDNANIQSVEDLQGKTVHIKKGKAHEEQLNRIKRRGIDFDTILHDFTTDEELIRMVSEKEIDITIADSTIAMLNRRYYPRIVIGEPISESFYIGWAVNRKAVNLLERIDRFLSAVKRDGTLEDIFDRYYGDIESFDYFDIRVFHDRIKSRLPGYVGVIKKYAQIYGFDWRLIAAQMYQESHFNPRARSHAGAHGLMQLTRPTAQSLGVKNIYDPEQNIEGGVKHLKSLYDMYDQAPEEDRMAIALAAYNVGQGHVADARNLAASLGDDPNRWRSVSEALLKLSQKEFHRNTLYGYCRGREPVQYVQRIDLYYDILKRSDIEPGRGVAF